MPHRELEMEPRSFRTRAELERQIDAARQLRAETLGGARWISGALAGVAGVIRRIMLRIGSHEPRQA
jgi:hypothetical protein